MIESVLYHCPSGCDLHGPSRFCVAGTELAEEVQYLTKQSKQVAFYEQPSDKRMAFWRIWNAASNRWLAHIRFGCDLTGEPIPPPEKHLYTRLARQALLQKLHSIRQADNACVCDQIIAWAEDERVQFTQLDERIEGQQMGFSFTEPQWRMYSQVYGVVVGDLHRPYRDRNLNH